MAGNKSASAIGNLVACQTRFPCPLTQCPECKVHLISVRVVNFEFINDIPRQFNESHRQLPPRVAVHAALRGVRGNALGVALLEAGAGRPSDADGREKPFRSKCC